MEGSLSKIVMKKYIKFIIRILLLVIIIILILFVIESLLKTKYKNNWDWEKENTVINQLKIDKYPKEGNEKYPLIINKNEEIPDKKNNEKRILVVGDSYIWGYSHTNINYTWWKQLEQTIKREGYNNISVYGAGRFGFSTEQQLKYILNNDYIVKKINPDLIIIGYVYNDAERKDKNNQNIIKDAGEYNVNNKLYKYFPKTARELEYNLNKISDNETYLRIIGKLFSNRYDIRTKMITEKENLKKYRNILKKTDDKIKELDIPYFYYFGLYDNNKLMVESNERVYNTMKELSINAYLNLEQKNQNISSLLQKIGLNHKILAVNPGDTHPGIVLTNYFGNEVYNILKCDYKYLFEENKKNDETNGITINDTMPYLNIEKIDNNKYEFEYPKKEKTKTTETKFLYYPVEKNYIKLSFEIPKRIQRIKITGKNLKSSELYINEIDENLGFDIGDPLLSLMPCEKVKNDLFEVNKLVSAVNIIAKFKNEKDRKITIEFIEE